VAGPANAIQFALSRFAKEAKVSEKRRTDPLPKSSICAPFQLPFIAAFRNYRVTFTGQKTNFGL
jgi:hypothetical protein